MDPIHPIAPGPPALPQGGPAPVQRLERIRRERDRPSRDTQERKRREPSLGAEEEHGGEDGERPRIDVRA
jgi:hypothetical protein